MLVSLAFYFLEKYAVKRGTSFKPILIHIYLLGIKQTDKDSVFLTMLPLLPRFHETPAVHYYKHCKLKLMKEEHNRLQQDNSVSHTNMESFTYYTLKKRSFKRLANGLKSFKCYYNSTEQC